MIEKPHRDLLRVVCALNAPSLQPAAVVLFAVSGHRFVACNDGLPLRLHQQSCGASRASGRAYSWLC